MTAPSRKVRGLTCAADGCVRTDLQGPTYCRMHYHRLRRSGTLHARPLRDSRGSCVIDGCGKTDRGPQGLCAMHESRKRRNGDPLIVKAPPGVKEALNPRWVGEDASYDTLHQRVRSRRGKASRHDCIDCGARASHWSYNNSGVQELRSQDGRRYSLDLAQYEPRCVPCHSAFDARARCASEAGGIR